MELNELRKIAEAATPGPWKAETHCAYTEDKYHAVYSVDAGDSPVISQLGCGCCDVGLEVSKPDAAFVAAFNPEAVLALLSRLEQAEQDRDKLRNRLDAMRRQRDGYRNQLRKAEQQVTRVRELHERIPVVVNGRWEIDHCKFCYEQDFSSNDAVWPCPTNRALDGDGRG